MKFHLENRGAHNVVRGYEEGLVRVGERILRSPCILTAQTIVDDWPVHSALSLTEADLAPVLAMEPEIVLLGTGRTCVFPPAQLRAAVQSRNIGFEVMDTAAACRTYNILISEDRDVVAALIVS